MKHLRFRLQVLIMAMLLPLAVAAQSIRYVNGASGDNAKDGTSWKTAKKDIQDAINDLVNNNLTGEVWVAAGTYYPTESTESSSSQYYKSFKIPAGITVRGGFEGTETSASGREVTADKNFGTGTQSGTLDGEEAKSGVYVNKTILCGDLIPSKRASLKWNDKKQQFDANFYGNSYHVVWFAMNGFNAAGRANPLAKPAKLEGCIVENGHAYTSDATSEHPHVGYGGGIYMVANSFVYNCEVRNCAASRNGGGIYMDGGGVVRRTYVHKCQALGLGTEFGLGGGICEYGAASNSKQNPIVVAQSAVTNCVSRMGGGMALAAEKTQGNNKYAVVANSTLVNNNTAQVEAGGVYTYKGGAVASMTIVNNKCNGSGITQGGIITGRSGGLYNRDAAYVCNSVIWGNECEANKNMQYANSRSSLADNEKSKFLYNALSNADIADWSITEKMGVLSLEDTNTKPVDKSTTKGFPLFFNPSPATKVVEGKTVSAVGYNEDIDNEQNPAKWTNWQVSSESYLTFAGISTADLDREGLTPAPTGISYDMQFGMFNSRPTIGALISQVGDVTPAMQDDATTPKKITYNGITYDEAYFVDPGFIYNKDNEGSNGGNWDMPIRFLGNILDIVGTQSRANENKKIAIFVKEGTVDNTRAGVSGRIRETTLNIPSNVTLIGSFNKNLKGEDLSQRNPVLTPTVISAKLMNDYKFNVAHLITIEGQENITVDGFKLTFANANSTVLGNTNKNGAAITLKNCQPVEGAASIHFANIIVSNCFADKGTVIYSDKSAATFENCIFHNNTTATNEASGLVYGINGSDLSFDHCNVLRSVGHASYLDDNTKNNWKNSMFYGNLDRAQDNTNNCATYSILAFEGNGAVPSNLTGERCMFDAKSKDAYDANGFNLGAGIPETSTYYKRTTGKGETDLENNPNGLEYAYTSGWANGYPRMVNPTKNAGYSEEGDVTYYGRATSFEPHNDNPVVNAATTGGEPHSARSWGKDVTTIVTRDFGGLPDIGAVESHIASSDEIANENGNPDGQMPYGVAYYVRDYAQPNMPKTYTLSNGTYTEAAAGKGNYVKEGENYVFLDGASWQYAVSGNANYGHGGTTTETFGATFKAVSETTPTQKFAGTFTIRSNNGGYYLRINNNSVSLTNNKSQATKFKVSAADNVTGAITAGTSTVSYTSGRNTYYLTFNTSGSGWYVTYSPSVSTNSANVNLVSISGDNYRIKYPSANRYYTGANSNLSVTNATDNTTSWEFVKDMTQETVTTWKEEQVPANAVKQSTGVAANEVVTDPVKLHVYESLEDFNNLKNDGSKAVTYKIKQGSNFLNVTPNSTATNYNVNTSTSISDSHDFALIKTGEDNKYFIYDVTDSRWLWRSTSNNNPVRTTATVSDRTAWYIVPNANKDGLNIILGSETLSANSNGWASYSGGSIQFKARTDATAQWTFTASKAYDLYNYTKQTIYGEYLNGLQYAVNTVHDEYMNGKEQHQVHVAKGTYTNRTNEMSVSQPYAYMMKEGVDVLGGYPTVGNPCEEQREPKKYETILQPSSDNPYVKMTFTEVNPGQDSGYDYMKVNDSDWSTYVKKDNTQDKASFARVLVQPDHFNVQTLWDGFTIQNGYLNTAYSEKISNALANLSPAEVRQSGGAGVLLQENGIIENCVVKDNVILIAPGQHGGNMIQTGKDTDKTINTDNIFTFITGGAGVFMSATMNDGNKTVKGVGGIVRNCEIYQNQLITKAYLRTGSRPDNIWQFGAGLYQNGGDVFNTIVHDNYAVTLEGTTLTNKGTGTDKNNEMMLGAGVFVSQGNFYNNTIVNNTACTYFQNHDNHCSFGGVHVFEKATIYNSLIAGNKGHWSYETWTSGTNPGNGVPVSAFEEGATGRESRDKTKVHVKYSFVDVKHGQTATIKTSGGNTVTVDVDLCSWNDERSEATKTNPDQAATNIYMDYNPNSTTPFEYTAETLTTYVYDAATYQLLTATSPCVNTGTEKIKDPIKDAYVVIPDVDAGYTDRIKDCKIDIGAYESDGTAIIAPQSVGDNMLVFYVSPEGYGKTNGDSPKNAACAPKLQKVLDAAGRQKLLNPDKQVIVKVANSYSMLHDENPSNFTYYATRTADNTSTDTRMWSIQIPRGVEVWGGYTDAALDKDGNVKYENETLKKYAWNDNQNGFYTIDNGQTYDHRSITGNPTFFDSYFYNKDMQINATTYHVVTFTERVFDTEGKPYMAADFHDGTLAASSSYNGTQRDESLFLHMNQVVSGNVMAQKVNGKTVSNRAVLDGIFVTGGNADGKAIAGTNNLNANGYGGAAIVTDYAYVRNCIVMSNSATNGGGLALTDRALVTGSLIMENNADNMGGGLYVFENGATLSNGIHINSKAPQGQVMDYNMAHVMTSTIVANTAEQGGGVWYSASADANARFNSVAIWQNDATDQANVHGMTNPSQGLDDEITAEEYYPFAYSLIQNMRASGTNNISAEPLNSQGVRFVNKAHDKGQTTVDQFDMAEEKNEAGLDAKLADFGFYGLTTYSMLCSNGMPKKYYEDLKTAIAIADDDILRTPRVDENSSFVEIGARALAKVFPTKQLMLRLFVANPEDVDTKTAGRFMRLNSVASPTPAQTYYSQEGSSFAYPFNSLQDALDYIKLARNGKIIEDNTDAKNLPFEILVGKGTYYPKKDLNGNTESVWAATYAIPEGVTIMGGFNPQGGVSDANPTYYGRYLQAKESISTTEGSINDNVDNTKISNKVTSTTGRKHDYGYETVTLPAETGGDAAKNITFQQWDIQDIADRRAMNDNNKNGIIEPWEFRNQTIISGNAVNGETKGVYHIMTAVADANAVGNMPKVQSTESNFTEDGYHVYEEGQQIRLNGLIITGGNAHTYIKSALDEYGKYIFYQGAGLQVDGNRYNTTVGGTAVFHNSAAYGVGYRDIPVSITNCQFRNNVAGYGGAISSNGSLSLFASSFEQNLAIADTEKPKEGQTWTTEVTGTEQNVTEVMYPGQGGAILATRQLSAFNTLFANNEARYVDKYHTASINEVQHPTFRRPTNGTTSLRASGGAIMMGSAAQHHIVNCDFVRNKANAYPAVFTMNPTTKQNNNVDTHDYSQIINTVAWGNEVNKISSDVNYLTASKLLVNIGKKTRTSAYSPAFTADNVPSASDLNVSSAEAGNWQEAVWFCAYEEGAGFTPNNSLDLRKEIQYSPMEFAPKTIIDAANRVKEHNGYQNCNLQIVADNGDVAGPNFGYPSFKAGYDGFMEGADWSPTRFNRLTDNGNGWIKQTVTEDKGKKEFVVTFHNDDTGTGNYQGAYPITHYISDIDVAAHKFPEYKFWLAIGNEKYMEATNEEETTDQYINGVNLGKIQKNLPRISPDPTMGEQYAYIDIGVYEYVKQPLLKPGSEVDILWVSTKEHPENGAADGATWKTPTSDLQRAIETLLSSRNGHKKEIRIMEGEYAPVQPKTVNGTKYNAFVIDTKSLNGKAITPTGFNDGSNNDEYYAQSITIKGGYSSELMYEYDPTTYKTIIRQENPGDGSNTDYLIYVADPTLRYAGKDTKVKNDGAVFEQTGDFESNTAKTMPVQVDGVTLINDKAAEGTKGSVIYYPDVTPERAHSVSVGGTVTYYEDAEHTKPSPNNVETDFPVVTGGITRDDPAKILITKTEVIGSGKKGDTNANASAVYIGQNGGSALIYNTVFHSNYGMPLDAYNTVNVNNTFAKNSGLVRLQDVDNVTVKSQMHNSVMWENNNGGSQFSMPDVTVVTIEGETKGNVSGDGIANFTYNSFTGGNTKLTGDAATAANNHNTGLININNDLVNGPNFVDPLNDDIYARNFDIKPSVRLLNKGMDTSITSGEGKYYTLVVNNKYDFALASTTDKDVLNRNRLNTPRIDIGAYEFQGKLNNILYVDPNKSHDDAATGEDWNHAFGYGDIQNAMDLAAISHMTTPTEEAYVFVKGNSSTSPDRNTNETITIRDGVTVYGSITSSYTDWHAIKKGGDGDDKDDPKYSSVEEFIKDLNANREGIASFASNKTIVTGVKTSEYTEFKTNHDGSAKKTPAIIDGVEVSNPGKTLTEPVVDVTNQSEDATIVLRNIIVAENDVTGNNNANVAQISNGLIYEALFRDNKTKAAVLKVEKTANTKGYAVNVTVEGVTIGADGSKPVDGGNGANTNIYNSITNSIETGATEKGAYGNIKNKNISGYFYNIKDANLNYQLTETSKYIDACATTNPLVGVANNLAQYINYMTDRDLLGNPRLLAGVTTNSLIDRGAFETWKVENNWHTGAAHSISLNNDYKDDKYAKIKQTFYPHAGSAVYLMEGKYLVLDAPGQGFDETTSNPGFLLVKEGANLYTNGRHTTCSYVAVEREVKKNGSIISMPYDMKYGQNVATVGTDSNSELVLTKTTGTTYQYDGTQRMQWNYIFHAENSPCWNGISESATTDACQGVFYAPNAGLTYTDDKVLLRFTAQGETTSDYIYEEDAVSKNIVLQKYDDAENSGNGADFTKDEDMGWNCIGLPYLVSEYKPYQRVYVTNVDKRTIVNVNDGDNYSMNSPKEMWLYFDGVKSPDDSNVNGDGGYYSVKSWSSAAADWHIASAETPAIWVGEGIFMQTATLSNTEDLTFFRPVAPAFTSTSTAKAVKVERFYNDATGIKEINTSDDAVIVATEYYTAGGLRIDKPRKGDGVVIIRNIYSDGSYKTSKRSFK